MSSIFLLHVDTATAVPQYNLYDKNTTINNPRIKSIMETHSVSCITLQIQEIMSEW